MTGGLLVLALLTLLGAAIFARVGARFTDWLVRPQWNFAAAYALARLAETLATSVAAREEARDAQGNIAAADPARDRVRPLAVVLPVLQRAARSRLRSVHLRRRGRKISEDAVAFASILVQTVEAVDPYVAGHSRAVAEYAEGIAEWMKLPRRVQARIRVAALLHDVGKIGLPTALLTRSGALTLEERRVMQQHAVIGERLTASMSVDLAEIVRHHHERYDGQGYPDGLAGDAIPLEARIIAVADAYDAMTAPRPYRDAMPDVVARLRLAQAVGTQFDPGVVAAFEARLSAAGSGLPARMTRTGAVI